jgi:hypothetical protein
MNTSPIDRLKFHYSLLNIMNILLEFEKKENIYSNLSLIYELLAP